MVRQAEITCSEVWGGNRQTDAALSLPGLEGWIRCRPHEEAESGGDVHYISSCGSGRITRLILADAAGHGAEAADLSGFLRSVMQRYLNHIEPHKLAAEINERLSDHERESGRFATALIMTYFSPTGELNICNAGHPPPLVYRRAKGTWAPIDQPRRQDGVLNLPLGVLEASGYSGRELHLEAGDAVLSYTDCLVEATDDEGHQLGTEGLLDVLRELGDAATAQPPGELIAALLRAIEARGYRCDDDLTAVVWRSTGPVRGAPPGRKLAGMLKTMRLMLTSRDRPWPELSVRNLGGALIGALNRIRPRRRKTGA